MEDDALDRRKQALATDTSELGTTTKAGLARKRKSEGTHVVLLPLLI